MSKKSEGVNEMKSEDGERRKEERGVSFEDSRNAGGDGEDCEIRNAVRRDVL